MGWRRIPGLPHPVPMHVTQEPQRRIRAAYTADTITVYQAYAPEIGQAAAREGRFPAAWKRDRMTWVKPSFLWMMYRCGWATKPDQETVLAVESTGTVSSGRCAMPAGRATHPGCTPTAPPGSGS